MPPGPLPNRLHPTVARLAVSALKSPPKGEDCPPFGVARARPRAVPRRRRDPHPLVHDHLLGPEEPDHPSSHEPPRHCRPARTARCSCPERSPCRRREPFRPGHASRLATRGHRRPPSASSLRAARPHLRQTGPAHLLLTWHVLSGSHCRVRPPSRRGAGGALRGGRRAPRRRARGAPPAALQSRDNTARGRLDVRGLRR